MTTDFARRILLVALLCLLILSSTAFAQDGGSSEPDTAAFIAATFQLQPTYNAVHCVSQDGTCPAEITTAVPCLESTCDHAETTYPISESYSEIQTAVDAAVPGDLVIVLPGRYAGVAVEDRGGADGAYIHIHGWGEPGQVVVDRVADPTKDWLRHLFYFINTHHFMISNISFTGAERGAGVFFSGYFSVSGTFSHHMIVSRVYAHDNFSWGMHTTAASQVLVQDSVFTNSADEHGLYVSGSGDDVVIRRNVFQGNNAAGVQVNPDPQTATMELFYWLQNTTGETCGWTEDDVEFTGPAEWHDLKRCIDQQGLDDFGSYIEDGISQNFIIEANIITGNGAAGGAGINLAALHDSIIRNNLIYGNDAAGIACWDNAYAEEKTLASSGYGCQNVLIANNTIVDETGSRGALILNNDARDMRVFNNIIVRDRYDAYEVTSNSGGGLRSGGNYIFAQSVTDSPGFAGEEGSVIGVTVEEALSQFAAPGFAPWILPDGDAFQLNPNRPDWHPLAGSDLAGLADTTYSPAFDLFGAPHSDAVGALTVTEAPQAAQPVDPAAARSLDPAGTITFSLEGAAYLMRDGELLNVSAALDAFGPGEDGFINISPDGQTILLETTRFDSECAGWSCWVLLNADLSLIEVVRLDGAVLHTEDAAAVASGAGHLVVELDGGPNQIDLFAISRSPDGGFRDPVLLSGESGYPFNRQPVFSDDGSRVLFDCRTEVYLGDGSAICEVSVDGSSFRVVARPEDAPPGYAPGGALHHADYAPDGSIIFEGDWQGEQLWRLPPGSRVPHLMSGDYNNDNTPCVLSSGAIASLWLGRPEGQGFHELKLMTLDGSQSIMLLTDRDITDGGLGCGG